MLHSLYRSVGISRRIKYGYENFVHRRPFRSGLLVQNEKAPSELPMRLNNPLCREPLESISIISLQTPGDLREACRRSRPPIFQSRALCAYGVGVGE